MIESFLAAMRPVPPSEDGTITIKENVTSILRKGDGTVEVRSS